MNKEFRLPDVGEGLTEADIVSWHVKPGDTVKVNQIIVEIETAKAVVELPSPYAGTVTALLADEGQTVDVGTPIISVDVPGPAGPGGSGGTQREWGAGATHAGGSPGGRPPGPAEPAPGEEQSEPGQPDGGEPAQPGRQPVLVGYGVKPGATTRRPRKPSATRPAAYPATPPGGLREIVPPAGGPRGQGGLEGPRGNGGRESPMPGGSGGS